MNMLTELNNKCDMIKDRSLMLKAVRSFFYKRGLLEIDPFYLNSKAQVDAHIDLVEAKVKNQPFYLHSSPEYACKEMLSLGVDELFFLGHVFRDAEVSACHQVEFTMIEWYRKISLEHLMMETIELAELFLGSYESTLYTYEEAFETFLGGMPEDPDRAFSFELQPLLPHDQFIIITDFPEDQAAFAKVIDGKAKRFELFFNTVELANGYDELLDPKIYLKRLQKSNQERAKNQKKTYPIDTVFLEKIEHLPNCTGVAMGFDRLMMLRHHSDQIASCMVGERQW